MRAVGIKWNVFLSQPQKYIPFPQTEILPCDGGTGCPQKLGTTLIEKCPRPDWMGLGATWSYGR